MENLKLFIGLEEEKKEENKGEKSIICQEHQALRVEFVGVIPIRVCESMLKLGSFTHVTNMFYSMWF